MSELQRDQRGFSLVETLLIGVIVVVCVSLGYVVYKSHSKAATGSTTTAHSTIANFLTIKEWGVKFELPSNLTSMDYEIQDNTAYLGSPQLEALASTCSVQNTALGVLTRATDISAFDPPQKPTRIGNYYYEYANPQDGCSNSIDAANMQANNYHPGIIYVLTGVAIASCRP